MDNIVSHETTLATEREAFIAATGVSHETLAKFDRYAAMLQEWNERINLVSASTLPHIWTRHFLDSWQLVNFIEAGQYPVIADLGSGAGFPGLVLAIMGVGRVHLIESIGKKANFLREVVAELGLNA